jgi:Fe-S oxidoreductase
MMFIANPELRATLCAPGTSCRHQIHDGAHREALHPVEVLARVLL